MGEKEFLMVDLCAGLKGASEAMARHGWKIVTVDINPAFSPDVVVDVRYWSWDGPAPDLIWASPPCNEFSREDMPWSRTGRKPDLSIVNACRRIIEEASPRYWIIENVRGAIPYLQKPAAIYKPFYLWGFFPPLGKVKIDYRHKESYSSTRKAERAKIPFSLSLAVALAIERANALPLSFEGEGEGTKLSPRVGKRLDFDSGACSFSKIVVGQLPRHLSGVGFFFALKLGAKYIFSGGIDKLSKSVIEYCRWKEQLE